MNEQHRRNPHINGEALGGLTAAQLVEHLDRHFRAIGSLVTTTDLAIARELVRRARRAERAEEELARR